MYTVVGYDKDNDIYEEYGEYSSIWPAYRKAIELGEMVKKGELRREDNGEPIDWIEIYGKWNSPDEYKVGVFQ
jgi:hypothetical protein